jgi:serine/threonine protein kinase
MKVALTVVKGPEAGRVLEFQEPRGFVIGRASDADFRLPNNDPYVSRRHVFLEICPPSCRLQDIGNTNPAHVNGEPFTECELTDGDIIEVGYTQLKVAITAKIIGHIGKCGSCGQPVELVPGEQMPARCPACVENEQRTEQMEQATGLVHCSSCNADLTKQANSDRRANEFHRRVIYACDKCISRGKEFAGVAVGDYEICRLLGEGGMGSVYLVYHRPTARVLALKQMKDLKDPVLVKRFEREIRLQKCLAHQNIVRCIDTGIDRKGGPYIVIEYVPGGSLEEAVIAAEGRLPRNIAINYFFGVLDGLEYLHSQSIVHRDIKPLNILLHQTVRSGHTGMGLPTPKLSDFGLAVSYARAGGTRVTKRGTGLGTLMFMPPEQVRDAGSVREPADIYAAGVMFYYLLTGKYSFDFPTPAEVLEFQRQNRHVWKRPHEALRALMQLKRIMHPFQIILSEDPTPIQKRDPSLPRELATVVDKAVRKEARERFQSAAEFRTALQQAVR